MKELKINFVVDVDPVPTARPRLSRAKGGHTHAYTPIKSKMYQERVGKAFKQAIEDVKFDNNLMKSKCYIDVKFFFAIPKTINRHKLKKKEQQQFYGRHNVFRPDIDNLLKSILDGLNGIAFEDDCQVALIRGEKLFVTPDTLPRAEVTLYYTGSEI